MTAADPLFSAATPRVFSIDPGRPFARDLARQLVASCTDDPLALAGIRIFVPTRRAVRTLTDAFIESATPGRATLLPRISALGDVDEDEVLIDAPEDIGALDLPPAVSSLTRQMILARLVAAAERAYEGQENWPAALAGAKELAALLDSFYAEEVSFDALKDLAPAQHAEHWDRSLKFLQIATRAWPAILAEEGWMDPAERRARMIDLEGERLQQNPPETPVIVAGTTGSAPAVARLMRVVARLPKGAVVLPGLDRALAADAKAWTAIDEEDAHPQAGLKAALAAMEIAADDVRAFPGAAESPRARLISLALRPAEATDDWLGEVSRLTKEDPELAASASGMDLIEAPDEDGEAMAVALVFREALARPGRTALLVTPDRDLSRRVSARMRRWGVSVDDSAGVPFTNSPCGVFMRLAAAWLVKPGDPVAALSLAKHPLASFGLALSARRRAVNAFDKGLRGLAPDDGVAGLERKIDANAAEDAAPVIETLSEAAAHAPGDDAPFSAWLDALIAAAECLAASNDEPGATRIWRGEDGETGAELFAQLREASETIGAVGRESFPDALAQTISGVAVRRRTPAHPRLAILGPLEARLQTADVVVLGGLNDGVWPGEAPVDPFLSRPMRREIGLPSPERRIGLAAHDFAQLASAPRVVLTRSERSGGAPTKPSRWIVRLKNILKGAGALNAANRTQVIMDWAAAVDAPAANMPQAKPPTPRPDLALRPRSLAVTRIERWLRDPYSIFAQYILRLKKLDPLGEPFGAKQLGSLFHKVFEIAAGTGEDPESVFARVAPDYGFGETQAAFHGPSARRTLDWFAAFDAERRKQANQILLEQKGALTLATPGGPFEITARADRIEKTKSGGAFIFDYKSRRIPTAKELNTFNFQLPLTALIVEQGGYEELGPAAVEGFAYLRAVDRKRQEDENIRKLTGGDVLKSMRDAETGLRNWIDAFDQKETPYLSQPRPQFVDAFGDYDLLARRREWSVSEDGGEE